MSEQTQQKIAEINANKPVKIEGFKILGIIPFYLGFIKTDTYIEICGLKSKIREIKEHESIKYSDADDQELLKKTVPLMREICVVGVINSSVRYTRIKGIIEKAIYNMSFEDMFKLYQIILEKSDPSFFLIMLSQVTIQNNTLLKEEEQSSDT